MFYVVFFLNVHIVFMVYSLDYPGVGPEHSYLKDIGRAEYYSVTDDEALEGMASTNCFMFSVVFLGFCQGGVRVRFFFCGRGVSYVIHDDEYCIALIVANNMFVSATFDIIMGMHVVSFPI